MLGQKVSDLKFSCTDEAIKSFGDLIGKNVVLYFYPKDNTPGCTVEGQNFNQLYPEFQKRNTIIIGVSKDSLASHERFCTRQGFVFPLISDNDGKLAEYFDVIIKDNLLKKLIFKVERSTFLIDAKGTVRHLWRKVKVKAHAQEVLDRIDALKLA
jgi:peroxiredoxin Q/BCP